MVKASLFALRIALGWMFLYAGMGKILNPQWSAAGYLKGAKTLPGFYTWLTGADVLPIINFINEWGLTLIGVSLILGIFVRLSSVFGAVLMLLYYLPVLDFPKAGANGFIVDEHIIYVLVFVFFASIKAGRTYGLDNWCANLPICSKFPKLRNLLG